MTAGKLDRRVQFHRAALVDDGFTSAASWSALGSPVWASRRDVSDSERVASAQIAAVITTRFQVRSSVFARGITAADRLICEGETFDIVGIKQVGRLAMLEITARVKE